jgi:hypothetical protein
MLMTMSVEEFFFILSYISMKIYIWNFQVSSSVLVMLYNNGECF